MLFGHHYFFGATWFSLSRSVINHLLKFLCTFRQMNVGGFLITKHACSGKGVRLDKLGWTSNASAMLKQWLTFRLSALLPSLIGKHLTASTTGSYLISKIWLSLPNSTAAIHASGWNCSQTFPLVFFGAATHASLMTLIHMFSQWILASLVFH